MTVTELIELLKELPKDATVVNRWGNGQYKSFEPEVWTQVKMLQKWDEDTWIEPLRPDLTGDLVEPVVVLF
jgi:hypothetical protein